MSMLEKLKTICTEKPSKLFNVRKKGGLLNGGLVKRVSG